MNDNYTLTCELIWRLIFSIDLRNDVKYCMSKFSLESPAYEAIRALRPLPRIQVSTLKESETTQIAGKGDIAQNLPLHRRILLFTFAPSDRTSVCLSTLSILYSFWLWTVGRPWLRGFKFREIIKFR